MELRKRTWKNKDGSKGIAFFIDWTEGGKRHRHRLKGVKTQKRADQVFGEFCLKHERGQLNIPTDPGLTVGECLDRYQKAQEANCVKKHSKTIEARVKELKAYFQEDRAVLSLSEEVINDFKNQQRTKKKPVEAPTINKKIGILKAAIEKAVKDGKIPSNPLHGVAKVSDSRPEAWRFLHENEIDALLHVLKHGAKVFVKPEDREGYELTLDPIQGLYPLVVFLLNTGARLGEAQALRWRDVDLKAGHVRLNTTKAAARGHKAKPRFITINSALKELLKDQPKDGEKVFHAGVNVERKFRRAVELAGIGHCRIHDLRHTFASHLAMNGIPLNTIREMLGHTTMTMTLRYAHLAPKVVSEAAETLNFGAIDKGAKIESVGEIAG